MDPTHDPALTSWVESAQGHPDFPIQNLPFGVFHRRDDKDDPSPARVGMAIGDFVLDLTACHDEGWFTGAGRRGGRGARRSRRSTPLLRARARDLDRAAPRRRARSSRADSPAYRANRRIGDHILVPMAEAELLLPVAVGDYTDFYASVHHATNVGSMFRPDNPLLPNYKWVPIGYHGRASSIVPSGTPVRRPSGQLKDAKADAPVFGPSARAGLRDGGRVLGRHAATRSARRCRSAEAEAHLFGLCLVNDWSARDVQSWEYQPLGPFLAKNFATTVSPWVVTLGRAGAVPRRRPPRARPATRAPLPYLTAPDDQARGAFDVTVEVWLSSARMRAEGVAPAAAEPRPRRRPLLDPGPDAGPPHQQRLQPRARRPVRERHDLRPGQREPRLPARAHLARRRAAHAPDRRDPRRSWRTATR